MAELYTGFPLFPGENEQDQLLHIMYVQGVPPLELLKIATRRRLFFNEIDEPIVVENSRGKKRLPNGRSLYTSLRNCKDDNFRDFLA